MARFAQYAMVASEEALKDAGWDPKSDEDLEATVRCHGLCLTAANTQQGVYMGSGIGNLDDAYNTAIAFDNGVRSMLVMLRLLLTRTSGLPKGITTFRSTPPHQSRRRACIDAFWLQGRPVHPLCSVAILTSN